MESINRLAQNSIFLKALETQSTEKLKPDNEKCTIIGFSEADSDRIIQMAWEDRTPFEAIEFQFGLKEKEVVAFMRLNSKKSSFRMWRERMCQRKTKHLNLRNKIIIRFKCSMQRSSGNKIAKR